MFFRRTERPADRAVSDRLLDAAGAGAPRTPDSGGTEPLAWLLAAAAAPARPGELAGEEEALASFRAARAAGPSAGPAPSPRRRRFTAGAAAWGAGIAVTATAGAAFAAVALDRAADPAPSPRPATPAPATTHPDRGGSTGATGGSRPTGPPSPPSAAVTSGAPAPGTTPGAAPGRPQQRTEQLRGLCRAYLAKKPEQREKALGTPAFARLVTAAGDPEQVEDFCRELVPEAAAKESPKQAPKTQPSPPTPAD
ncbi:hypothetical protein AB0D32_21680 [Micromonospora sp. NPDC048170]|uniref:hypothetical protein n=1 Tax=Micromonospora sp. NPDC048170 TaxID=3154819 RepID=UPI0033F81EC2